MDTDLKIAELMAEAGFYSGAQDDVTKARIAYAIAINVKREIPMYLGGLNPK